MTVEAYLETEGSLSEMFMYNIYKYHTKEVNGVVFKSHLTI